MWSHSLELSFSLHCHLTLLKHTRTTSIHSATDKHMHLLQSFFFLFLSFFPLSFFLACFLACVLLWFLRLCHKSAKTLMYWDNWGMKNRLLLWAIDKSTWCQGCQLNWWMMCSLKVKKRGSNPIKYEDDVQIIGSV